MPKNLTNFDPPKKLDNLTDIISLFRRETYDQFEPVYDRDYYNSIYDYDQTEEPGILTFDYLKPGIRKK